MKKRTILILLVSNLFFLIWGCVYTGVDRIPPSEIKVLYPKDGSSGIETTPFLSWKISKGEEYNPQGFKVYLSPDKMKVENMNCEPYDVNIGNGINPEDFYSLKVPTKLEKNTEYYWRVTVYDESYGSLPGPIWKFKTNNMTTRFSTVLSAENPDSMIGDSDGFMVGMAEDMGKLLIEKLDYDGNLLWKRSFESSAFDFILLGKFQDGEYAACYGEKLLRLSRSGEVLKATELPNACENLSSENGFVYIIYPSSSGNTKVDKFDENLVRVDTYTFPVSNIKRLFADSEGNFTILGGDYNEEGKWQAYVTKMYESGTEIWRYSITESRIVTNMRETNEGYVLIGFIGPDGMFITKISNEGDVVLDKSYYRSSEENPLSSILVPMSIVPVDSGFVITGFSADKNVDIYSGDLLNSTNFYDDFDAFVAKLDEDGNIISLEKFGGSRGDVGIFLQVVNDSKVIVAGMTKSNDGDVNSDINESEFPNGAVWVFGVDASE